MKGKNKDNRKGKKLLAVMMSFLMTISSFTVVVAVVSLSLSFMATPVPAPDHMCEEGSPCCFMPGTPINLADGGYKNIEEIEIGDMVLVFNEKTMEVEIASVTETDTVMRNDVFMLFLENGKKLKPVGNHPFYTRDKGWATINGVDEVGLGCGKLEVGDSVYYLDDNNELGLVKVVGIFRIPGRYLTYNLVDMKYGTFLADDVVTHNSGDDDPIGHNIVDCFIAGTQISMADGSTKNIEDVCVGDIIKTVDVSSMKIEYKPVLKLLSTYHTGIDDDITISIKFSDGSENQNTNTHPYFVKDKGYASYAPDLTKQKYGLDVALLNKGDIVYKTTNNELSEITVLDIIEIYEPVQTYNLMDVKDNNNFFANAVLVHNKDDDPPSDTTPPTVSFSPSSSATWATSSPSITVSCSDSGGLNQYWYKWSTSTSTPSSYDVGPIALSANDDDFEPASCVSTGLYYLHVKATDDTGNARQTCSGSYYIDNTAPTITDNQANDNTWRNSNSGTYNVDFSDANSGLDWVKARVDAGTLYTIADLSAASSYTTNWALPSSVWSALPDGQTYIDVRARDEAGKIRTTNNIFYVRKDTVNPTAVVTIDEDDGHTSTGITLSCSYSDSHSGVKEVRYSDDGISWSSWEPASSSRPFTLDGTDGDRTVYYEVKDNVGNTKQDTDTILYNQLPICDGNIDDSVIYMGESTTLTSTSTDEGSIVNWSWDLNNDGAYDEYGETLAQTFDVPYNYGSITLRVRDEEGAESTTTMSLEVREKRTFSGTRNTFTWLKNNSYSCGGLAAELGMSTNPPESIRVFKYDSDCDWQQYIHGTTEDISFGMNTVLEINLADDRTISNHDFGTWDDTVNSDININLIDTDKNGGYIWAPFPVDIPDGQEYWLSDFANDIGLAVGSYCYLYDKDSDSYPAYLKMPGDITARTALDRQLSLADQIGVRLPDAASLTYDSTQLSVSSQFMCR